MNQNIKNLSIEERILLTLEIVEERGYNLTIEKLSKLLVGGEIKIAIIKDIIENSNDIEYDGVFIGKKGNLQRDKCLKRLNANSTLKKKYESIAKNFVNDYIKICPWIQCIMLTGSMATDGLVQGDDIDLNIIVSDKTKYFTWLIGIILSLKYSLKYRKQFHVPWYNLIKGVICICIIWEQNQVFPFVRKDKQIAYELFLNSNIIYNPTYYQELIDRNKWLMQWFPQAYKKHYKTHVTPNKKTKSTNKIINIFLEPFAKKIFFLLYRLFRSIIFWNDSMNQRIDHVLSVQSPYSIIDDIENHE